MQQVFLTPPDIMRTDFPPTETTLTRGIRTFLNGQSIQFKIIINALPSWEESEAIRISKGNMVRHLQWQCAPCLQNGWFGSPDIVKGEYLDLYTTHYLCVKRWTHMQPGQCFQHVQDPLKLNIRDRTTKAKMNTKWQDSILIKYFRQNQCRQKILKLSMANENHNIRNILLNAQGFKTGIFIGLGEKFFQVKLMVDALVTNIPFMLA